MDTLGNVKFEPLLIWTKKDLHLIDFCVLKACIALINDNEKVTHLFCYSDSPFA